MILLCTRLALHVLLSCALVIAGLMVSFQVENEHGQMGVGYAGLFVFGFLAVGLPLSFAVASVTELVWQRKNMLIIPVLLAISASFVFLKTGPFKEMYFTSDRSKAPLLIGRSLEFLNPKPKTQMSNVGTYFPILVIATFFLPFATRPAAGYIGLVAERRRQELKGV